MTRPATQLQAPPAATTQFVCSGQTRRWKLTPGSAALPLDCQPAHPSPDRSSGPNSGRRLLAENLLQLGGELPGFDVCQSCFKAMIAPCVTPA